MLYNKVPCENSPKNTETSSEEIKQEYKKIILVFLLFFLNY